MALQEKEGIPVEQMRLVFGGKQLADEKTIKDYNIEAGSTMLMVLQLRVPAFKFQSYDAMIKQEFRYIDSKSEIHEEVDYMKETMLFSLKKSEIYTNLVQSLFMQNSIIVDFKGEQVGDNQKNDIFDLLALKFSSIYNQDNVIENSPVTADKKEELRRSGERFSNKHLSYFNISLSTSFEKNALQNSFKNQFLKYNISKMVRNKTTGNELIVYNASKNNWKSVLLDNFNSMKNPCRHHTHGTKSGYYFIYDNQGLIHVLYDNMQICELTLPDERQDPSLFVYEKNVDQSILLVAGGYIKSGNSMAILDSVAVFFLNFKELSKLLRHDPIFYIKLKYPRLCPTIFKFKQENELMFIFLGGNDLDRIQAHHKDATRKSMLNLFDSSNMFCETLSFKRIRDSIFKTDFHHPATFVTTEDTLLLILNGQDLEGNPMEKIRFHMDEAAVLRFKPRKNGRKLSYLVGAGRKKNEIWLVDKLDLVEHKLYLMRYSQSLKPSKTNVFCKAMVTILDQDLFYFNEEQQKELKFKKMRLQGKENGSCGKGGCRIF